MNDLFYEDQAADDQPVTSSTSESGQCGAPTPTPAVDRQSSGSNGWGGTTSSGSAIVTPISVDEEWVQNLVCKYLGSDGMPNNNPNSLPPSLTSAQAMGDSTGCPGGREININESTLINSYDGLTRGIQLGLPSSIEDMGMQDSSMSYAVQQRDSSLDTIQEDVVLYHQYHPGLAASDDLHRHGYSRILPSIASGSATTSTTTTIDMAFFEAIAEQTHNKHLSSSNIWLDQDSLKLVAPKLNSVAGVVTSTPSPFDVSPCTVTDSHDHAKQLIYTQGYSKPKVLINESFSAAENIASSSFVVSEPSIEQHGSSYKQVHSSEARPMRVKPPVRKRLSSSMTFVSSDSDDNASDDDDDDDDVSSDGGSDNEHSKSVGNFDFYVTMYSVVSLQHRLFRGSLVMVTES